MMKCEICDKEMKGIPGLAIHIKKAHPEFTIEKYYNKYIKKNHQEGICFLPSCFNKTKFINLRQGYNEYCSREHSVLDYPRRKDDLIKKKIDEEARKKKVDAEKERSQWFDDK